MDVVALWPPPPFILSVPAVAYAAWLSSVFVSRSKHLRSRCTILEKTQAVGYRDGVVLLVMAYMLERWDTDVNIQSDQEDVKNGQG